ncbi:MAG TPA: hypothetical protein VN920_03355 [Pyrinomonadaceae bacterium]|nr:hypothetical protein [Pyrinomonadaceae bacterium]
MKKIIVLLSICATIDLLSSIAFSRPLQLQLNFQTQTRCSLESKNQYYRDFVANSEANSDQAKALEAAKNYLACPGEAEDLANLNFAVARMLSKDNSHEEAIRYFIKAASYDSKIRTLPETYFSLGEAYEKGSYARLAAVYRARFEGKDETDASLLALANINQIVDCIIDAYARAVVLAGDEWRQLKPRAPSLDVQRQGADGVFSQPECMEAITFWYRARHNNSEAGLKEMFENILSRPQLPEPTPITSLPPGKESRQYVPHLSSLTSAYFDDMGGAILYASRETAFLILLSTQGD